MRDLIQSKFVMLAIFAATTCYGQTNRFELPMWGTPLPATKFKLVNHIPKSSIGRIPKRLPVLKYSGQPREFSTVALQSLLDQTPFVGTNLTELLKARPAVSKAAGLLRFATPQGLDYFVVNPAEGRIIVQCVGTNRGTPPPDAVPSFEEVRNRLFNCAAMFNIRTNEMERDESGGIHLSRRDRGTSRMGGAVQFKESRCVEIPRGIEGFSMRSLDEDKMQLELGINGQLLRFDLKWPTLNLVRTNRVLSISKIMEKIKNGEVLGDVTNEYPPGEISEIELKDIRVEYYVPATSKSALTNVVVYPIASIYAVFKTKTGEKEDGGLFTPIMKEP